MFERFERPLKILCLALAALLVWQLASVILRGDPLAHLKIPALPTLPGGTNATAKLKDKRTNAAVAKTPVTNGTNATTATNVARGTNVMAQTNASSGPELAGPRKSRRPDGRPGQFPEMGGGMPGGRGGAGLKKVELPPEVQTRVDRIIDSEIFGPIIRPVPMALVGISDEEAFIQATNGQTGPVKIGGEIGGIKLLRIGINRVLVEQDGEKKELTIFGGAGGESLMPNPTPPPSTNAPTKRTSMRNATSQNATAN